MNPFLVETSLSEFTVRCVCTSGGKGKAFVCPVPEPAEEREVARLGFACSRAPAEARSETAIRAARARSMHRRGEARLRYAIQCFSLTLLLCDE